MLMFYLLLNLAGIRRAMTAASPIAPASPAYPAPATARGTVYGTALNYRGALAALGDVVRAAPYLVPPRAPVLYIKPRNTWIGDGDPIPLPTGHAAVVAGPALGLVFGGATRRVSPAQALEQLRGYVLVNDVALPHDSYFRPALQQQCRDGFCAIGANIVERARIADVDALTVRVHVNGTLRLTNSTAGMIRNVRQLIADVSEFMTLQAGDILLTGLPEHLPLAGAGDRITVEIDGLGRLDNPVVPAASLAGAA